MKEENKALKEGYKKEFEKDLKATLPKTKEKFNKIVKSLDDKCLKNWKISNALIKSLSNKEIIDIITKKERNFLVFVEGILQEIREDLKEKEKKAKGKKKEVISLHIDWLLSDILCYFSEIVVEELIDYLRGKKDFQLETLIYQRLKF